MSNERNEGKKMNQKFSSELGKWRLCDKIGEKPFMKAFCWNFHFRCLVFSCLARAENFRIFDFCDSSKKKSLFISAAGRAFC
jgi:hypothetical protein